MLLFLLLHFLGFGFQSSPNTTTTFSLGWIRHLAITRVTGICVQFMFKMDSRNNNGLSLSKETSSGVRNHIWSLSGYHGNRWNEAWVTLTPKENLMVRWYTAICRGDFLARFSSKNNKHITFVYEIPCRRLFLWVAFSIEFFSAWEVGRVHKGIFLALPTFRLSNKLKNISLAIKNSVT